jgi:hypothetical protein
VRTCGDCTVCCYIGGVPEIGKPAHSKCQFLCNTERCSLYGRPSRPEICNKFECAWLQGHGLPEDRPDLSGVFCFNILLNGGDWVFVVEATENAAMTTGRDMVERLSLRARVPVIIVDHGVQPPDDKGNRVVIKSELQSRSKRIRGKFIDHLDDDKSIGVYDLVVG